MTLRPEDLAAKIFSTAPAVRISPGQAIGMPGGLGMISDAHTLPSAILRGILSLL